MNARNGDDEKELQQTSCAITCEECSKKVMKQFFEEKSDEHEVAVDA